MSFFSKFKSGNNAASQAATAEKARKDLAAAQQTALEKHIADISSHPVRADGSDKFFGYENYGSTCYCNSIIQCLYYSAPFREHVLNFPGPAALDDDPSLVPVLTSTTPYPNLTSPARKVVQPLSPTSPNAAAALSSTLGAQPENKDSPEARKRAALAAGPVLGLTHSSAAGYGLEESLFTALRDLFAAIIAAPARIGVVSPHRFLELLRRDNEMFRSAMHQDAHEFLNFLLNAVVDEVELILSKSKLNADSRISGKNGGLLEGAAPGQNGTLKAHGASDVVKSKQVTVVPDARWVHDLFEGRLTSETCCLTCETVSQRDEPFLDLSVDLSPHTSVTACLRKFSEEEMLCERNKFHCDTCGGLQEAEKRMKIKRLPKVLALHLKRFKYTDMSSGDGGAFSTGPLATYQQPRLHKLFHRVVYPFHLRLFDTTDDAEDADKLYELYAVVVHIGGGPYHGHYVSIVKTQDRGWLLFDDELVEPVDSSYVLNFFGGEPVPGNSDPRQLACAYVLFYQETTVEAMLREEEAQANPPTATPATATAAELRLSADLIASAKQQSAYTAQTPAADDALLDPLAHTLSAPATSVLPDIDSHTARPGLAHLSTAPALAVVKTRGEMRQAEKERRAEEKAQWRVDEEERNAASRPSKRPDEKEGGLGRFRPVSMSIRGKSRLFGNKDKEKEALISDREREAASSVYTSPPSSAVFVGVPFTANASSGAGSSTTGTGSTSSLTNGASLSALHTSTSSTADVSSSLPFSPLLATPTPPADVPSTSSSNQYFNEPSSVSQKPSLTARKSSMRRNPFSSFGRDKDKSQPLPPAPTSAPRGDIDSLSRSVPSRSGLQSSNGSLMMSSSYNSNGSTLGAGRPDLSRLTSETSTALPAITSAHSTNLVSEEKDKEKKKNRFSLGRKKSAAFT